MVPKGSVTYTGTGHGSSVFTTLIWLQYSCMLSPNYRDTIVLLDMALVTVDLNLNHCPLFQYIWGNAFWLAFIVRSFALTKLIPGCLLIFHVLERSFLCNSGSHGNHVSRKPCIQENPIIWLWYMEDFILFISVETELQYLENRQNTCTLGNRPFPE